MSVEPNVQRTLSRIVPLESERTAGALGRETIERASRCFRADGALVIEDVVDGAIIAAAQKAFDQTYSHYLNSSEHEDALNVGDRRMLITIRLEPPFDTPRLFANPYVLPILSAALDEGFVIGAFGVVCALPSAPAQHVHHDGGDLFQRPDLDRLLPTAAITVGIPLLEMNGVNGTTTLWLGSHHDRSGALDGTSIEPEIREGSCVLWDFRLKHSGTANLGTSPRPLLYLTYCRPWFLDHINFSKTNANERQKPLLASRGFLLKLSEQQQCLLVRALSD